MGQSNFITDGGSRFSIEWDYKFERTYKTVYVGKEFIYIIFDNSNTADKWHEGLESMIYPHKLNSRFSKIRFETGLNNGKWLIVVEKGIEIVPLKKFINSTPATVAATMSQMQELGFVLELNHLDMDKINIHDFYINEVTHEVYLLDGWDRSFESETSNLYLQKTIEVARELLP